ncbi:MAG: hypothetical protein ACT4NL_10840 [Pseudomarimonas sp.]
MRTTLEIDDDVLTAARDLGRRQHKSLGSVISELARCALVRQPAESAKGVGESPALYGFDPLPARGVVVTNELIDRLRVESGD